MISEHTQDDRTYKFLNSQHFDNVLTGGTIKLGSLTHYRGVEADPQWISDRLEGRVEINAGGESGIVITEHDNPLDRMLPPSLVGRHAVARSGGRIIIRPGVKMLISPEINPFIFSASKGPLRPLIDEMCGTSPQPYDACIGIKDIALLAHRLFYRGIVGELGNAKVSQVFTHFVCRPVSYDNLSRGSEHGQAPEASPFLKDIKFASQREIRVALFPRAPIANTTLIVQLPRPDQLFSEVFREVPSSSTLNAENTDAAARPR
jgi:hypothetical protein